MRPNFRIKEIKSAVKANKGKCLFTDFANMKSKVVVVCAEGHQWTTTPTAIRSGSWCKICRNRQNGINKRLPLSYVQKFVKSKYGGSCLEKVYPGGHARCLFKCRHGHEFSKLFINVQRGQWCSKCTESVAEKFCREFLSRLFQKPFIKVRTKELRWLIQPDGKRLELDGYCADLRLAFEHQGAQHSQFVGKFHKNKDDYKIQKKRDQIKRDLCKQNAVTLIEIPELSRDTRSKVMSAKIVECLNSLEIDVPKSWRKIKVPTKVLYSSRLDETFQFYKDYAESRGGKIVSEGYVNANTPIRVQCKKGHEWSVKPNNLKQKSYWCARCKNKVSCLEDIKQIAFEREGKLLSLRYRGANKKYRFKCNKAHEWVANASSVARGTWCPDCGGSKRCRIEDIRKLIESKDGQMISKVYKNDREKLKVICDKGHKIQMSGGHIKQGSWCAKCAGNTKKSLEDLIQFAESRGGKCNSIEYLGAREKYSFTCAKNHTWSATASSIFLGSWCRVCSGCAKTSIETLTQIAAKSGGHCLSKHVKDVRTNVWWGCTHGHKWEATPMAQLKRKKWCRSCKS